MKIQKLEKRWVFRQDEDCHWYMIPIEKVAEFERLLELCSEEVDNTYFERKFIDDFSDCMLDGGIESISFVNPAQI